MPGTPRSLASQMMRVLIIATLVCHASAALFGRNNKQALREFRGAELSCAAFGGAAGYVTSGNLYKTSVPPGWAYRSIRLPLLTRANGLPLRSPQPLLVLLLRVPHVVTAWWACGSQRGPCVGWRGRQRRQSSPRRVVGLRSGARIASAKLKEWLRTHTQAARFTFREVECVLVFGSLHKIQPCSHKSCYPHTHSSRNRIGTNVPSLFSAACITACFVSASNELCRRSALTNAAFRLIASATALPPLWPMRLPLMSSSSSDLFVPNDVPIDAPPVAPIELYARPSRLRAGAFDAASAIAWMP